MDQITFHLDHIIKSGKSELIDFDGPLDLILFLLSKNKIEIKDIQISLILDQYLEWIQKRKDMNLEVTSDFISMASHLVYLKGRMLLSYGNDTDAEVDELIQSLEKRRNQEIFSRLKEVCPELRNRWEFGRNIYLHSQESISPNKRFEGELPVESLLQAFQRIEIRKEKALPPEVASFQQIVGREPYPVSQKISDIVKSLYRTGVMKFKSFFSKIRTKSEAAATLLAVLNLYRNNRIDITYNNSDYEIAISKEEQKYAKSGDSGNVQYTSE